MRDRPGAVLRLGNLWPRRDLVPVDEAARAVVEMTLVAPPGLTVANVATGAARSMQEVIDMIGEILGKPLPVEIDPARVRPVERAHLQADVARLKALIGRAPADDLRRGLTRLLTVEGLDRCLRTWAVRCKGRTFLPSPLSEGGSRGVSEPGQAARRGTPSSSPLVRGRVSISGYAGRGQRTVALRPDGPGLEPLHDQPPERARRAGRRAGSLHRPARAPVVPRPTSRRLLHGPVERGLRLPVWEQRWLPAPVRPDGVDLLHSPFNTGSPGRAPARGC